MKNKQLQNTLKAIFIYPICLFIALPIIYLFNDMDIKETYKDIFKGFFKWLLKQD